MASSAQKEKPRNILHLMDSSPPTIQKGIPIPPMSQKKNGTDEKWPMSQLEVGDSFFARGVLNPGGMYKRAKMVGIKITCRRIGKTGVRVWRTE
jgi:hypothetical protein